MTVDYISILMFFLLGCVFIIEMLYQRFTKESQIAYIGDVWYFSDSIFMGWHLYLCFQHGDERTCVYNFAYFAGSLHMENDENSFSSWRSGLQWSGSSDSSVFSERDAL